MIIRDAKELAGQFHDMQRSKKFRRLWPRWQDYVEEKWPHFVDAVRRTYSELLGKAHVKQEDKDLMYEALLTEAPGSIDPRADTTLQIAPNTQQFIGDKHENQTISDVFGDHGSFKNALKSRTALH